MMMVTDARYEDECGEWAYDYRMEEYGYTLDPSTGAVQWTTVLGAGQAGHGGVRSD